MSGGGDREPASLVDQRVSRTRRQCLPSTAPPVAGTHWAAPTAGAHAARAIKGRAAGLCLFEAAALKHGPFVHTPGLVCRRE